MGNFISLSTTQQEEIVGAIYEMIEQYAEVGLENEHYYKIEENLSGLIDYLND